MCLQPYRTSELRRGYGRRPRLSSCYLPQGQLWAHLFPRTTCSEGDVCGSASMCDGPHAGFPRRATLAAPKGKRPYTEETPSGAAPTSPPEREFRHTRLMELDELSGRTKARLRYIGPTLLREYVSRTTSRTPERATSCTMDHTTDRATQRCTPDQQPLLRHRAVHVGPADVQRGIHTYGDRGPAPLVRRR